MHACIAALGLDVVEEDLQRFKDRRFASIVFAYEGREVANFDSGAFLVSAKVLKNYSCKFQWNPLLMGPIVSALSYIECPAVLTVVPGFYNSAIS